MSETSRKLREGTCPFVGMRPFRLADSHVFFGRDSDLLSAAHNLGSIAGDKIFVVTGPPGCGKSSFVHAALLPHLLSTNHAHAALDLSAAHDLRTFTARTLLSSTSQSDAARLSARLADLMIVDPAAAAEHFREFLRADLPDGAPPTPVVVDHLERLLSKDEAELLPGGIPAQSRAGRNVLALFTELARFPDIIVLATARSYHFQNIAALAPDGVGLFNFPLSHIRDREALSEIFHLGTDPSPTTENAMPSMDLRRSAIDLVSRIPTVLPFVTSLLARLYLTGSESSGKAGKRSADRMLIEVMADHADAVLESLPWDVDSGFNPLFRLLLPDAQLPQRKNREGQIKADAILPVPVPISEIGAEWEVRRAAMALVDSHILTIREGEFEGPALEASFPHFLSRWKFSAAWISRSQKYASITLQTEFNADAWKHSGRCKSTLLPPGDLRDLAARVVSEDPDRLTPTAINFVKASLQCRHPVKKPAPNKIPAESATSTVLPASLAALFILAGLWFTNTDLKPVRYSAPAEPIPVSISQFESDPTSSGALDVFESALQPISYIRSFEPSADDLSADGTREPSPLTHPHLPLPPTEGRSPATAFLLSEPDEELDQISESQLLAKDGCDPQG